MNDEEKTLSIRRKENGTRGSGAPSPARQPFSDGSEEFYEQFIPRDEMKRMNRRKNALIGVGVTLGVVAGAGTMLWFLKGKNSKPWWRHLLGK